MNPPTEVGVGVDFSDQMAVTIIVSVVMEKLKKWDKIPFISHASQNLNRWIALTVNFLIQIGVGISYTGSVWDGGTVTLSYPSIWTLYALFKGVLYQEFAHRASVWTQNLKKTAEVAAAAPKKIEVINVSSSGGNNL